MKMHPVLDGVVHTIFGFIISQLLFTVFAGLAARVLRSLIGCPVVSEKAFKKEKVPCCCNLYRMIMKLCLILSVFMLLPWWIYKQIEVVDCVRHNKENSLFVVEVLFNVLRSKAVNYGLWFFSESNSCPCTTLLCCLVWDFEIGGSSVKIPSRVFPIGQSE